MLNQLYNFPRHKHFIVAVSGGVDSMAVSDFYHRGGKDFSLAYFHHSTPQADEMQACVEKWAKENNRKLYLGSLNGKTKPAGQSPEEFWRHERYKWLSTLGTDIITAHHLSDATETYIFRMLNGHSDPVMASWGVIYRTIVYRPFLTTSKEALISWATRHNVPWVEDKSNVDVSSPRNRIRHNILPECLKVNPGLAKVVKKLILARVK